MGFRVLRRQCRCFPQLEPGRQIRIADTEVDEVDAIGVAVDFISSMAANR